MDKEKLGRIAYESYCNEMNWKSIQGLDLPPFDRLSSGIKGAWIKSTACAVESFISSLDESHCNRCQGGKTIATACDKCRGLPLLNQNTFNPACGPEHNARVDTCPACNGAGSLLYLKKA